MTLFPNLPFCQQNLLARQQILADLRLAIKSFRLLKQDAPRIRIRTLDVIPLAFRLPRSASLEHVTHSLSPSAPLSVWFNISTLDPTACRLLETLFQFFEQKHSALHKRIPPLLTWNPSSLATVHQSPSPKLRLILKRARSHICFVQETNWGSVQYNHVSLSAPFCNIYHSPATGDGSSGIATFLPHPLTVSSHSIITPGYLLTVSTSIGGLSVELINVYLHPRKISPLSSTLLAHLQSEHSRSHDLRFLGGDLNQVSTKDPNIYQQITMELNCTSSPTIPTYRLPNGYSSHLDAFLLQYPDYVSPSPPKFLTFWPSFQRTGHGILICKISRTPSVKPSVDDLPAPHIPSSVFYNPPSQQDSSTTNSTSFLPHLHRSLLRLSNPSTMAVKSTIWAWWHSYGKQPRLTPTNVHHFHILSRKLNSTKTRNVTVPLPSINWLLSHFPSDPHNFPIHHDSHVTLPAPLLSDLLIKYELLHPPTSNVTRTQFSVPSPATWSKCRVAAPKIWAHQGVIKSESGKICTTSASLDAALRATRSFWQDFPTPFHHHWTELLSLYAERVSPVPHCSPPDFDDFYRSITSSPDSAPGADGLPFAAWRVAPAVSANALVHHFSDIQNQTAPPPLQSLVFIPKADKGDFADNYRPLGLPNTCDRLIDRAAYSRFASTLVGALHPAQALLNTFREPQANFLTVQHFLNNTQVHGCVLLSNLAKAFERVNPHWIMHVLFHLKVPYWVIVYCRHILFGRKALHKIGAYFRPPIALRTGVDMGRAFSVLLFCIAMDPWYHHVHSIPRVCINAGYMDDNATGGHGLSWLPAAQTLILKFYSAGFQVLKHSCYNVIPISTPPPQLPHIEECAPPSQGYPSLWTAFAATPECQFVKLISGTLSITLPSSWIHVSSVLSIPSHPHLLTQLHTSSCPCKCKTFLIPNFQLSHNDLIYLDSTPFGAKIVSQSATMLGLFLHSPFTSVSPSNSLPHSTRIDPLDIEYQQTKKACVSMERRLHACLPLHLSFRDRTLFLSFYVLSLPHYHHSILLPSETLINHYISLIRKFSLSIVY